MYVMRNTKYYRNRENFTLIDYIGFQFGYKDELKYHGYEIWKSSIGWSGVIHVYVPTGSFRDDKKDITVWGISRRSIRRQIARKILSWKKKDRRYNATKETERR